MDLYIPFIAYLIWLFIVSLYCSRDINLNSLNPSYTGRYLFHVFGGIAASISLYVLLRFILPFNILWVSHSISTITLNHSFDRLLYFPLVLLLGPLTEELIFRELLYKHVVGKSILESAILSCIFSFTHTKDIYFSYIILFFVSLFLNYLYSKGGLWPCVFFHSGLNLQSYYLSHEINKYGGQLGIIWLIVLLAVIFTGFYIYSLVSSKFRKLTG